MENSVRSADGLRLVEQGLFYGHPNENRGRTDPAQRSSNTPEFVRPIATNGCTRICQGLAEYASDAFGGAMEGDLISVSYYQAGAWRLHLSGDGRSVLGVSSLGTFGGSIGIGVAVSHSGIIYGPGGYLKPTGLGTVTPTVTQPNTRTQTPTITLTPLTPYPTATPSATDTPTNTPPPTPTPLTTGDANCSGTTDSLDAAIVLQFAAQLLPEIPCYDRVDLDRNGHTDALDPLLILQCSAGLRDC